jgi:hypothetical protein
LDIWQEFGQRREAAHDLTRASVDNHVGSAARSSVKAAEKLAFRVIAKILGSR